MFVHKVLALVEARFMTDVVSLLPLRARVPVIGPGAQQRAGSQGLYRISGSKTRVDRLLETVVGKGKVCRGRPGCCGSHVGACC